MDLEQQLKPLRRQRASIKQRLTWFSTFLDKVEASYNSNNKIGEQTILDLQHRTEKLRVLIEEFESIQVSIEQVCDEADLENQFKERIDFFDQHAEYFSKSKYILSKLLPDEGSSTRSNNSQVNTQAFHIQQPNDTIRLPPISLPSFNGDFEKWLEFRDTFDSLINKNAMLSDIQRFHYLRSSLESKVSNIIDNLEFSDKNYTIAWKTLCNRFDNKHLLVNSHIKALFNLKYIQDDSAKYLRQLIDSVRKHLHALKNLQLPNDHDLSHALLVFMVSERLNKNALTEWEKHNVKGDLPTIHDLLTFLENKADFLETMEAKQNTFQPKGEKKPKGRYSFFSSDVPNDQKPTCHLCGESHLIYHCLKFLKLNISQRWDKIKELKLCTNCLTKGHFNKDCSYGNCKHCENRHNSLLHHQFKKTDNIFPQNLPKNDNSNVLLSADSNAHENLQESDKCLTNSISNDIQNKVHVKFSSLSSKNYVMLSTALMYIADSNGKLHKARAVLDSGSQSCFISNELCQRLNLKQMDANISIVGINNINSNLKAKCIVSLGSLYNDSSYNVTCYVLPQISENLPCYDIDVSLLNIPNNIQLADPEFHISNPVDILIGSNLFWNILKDGKVVLGKNLPVLQNTSFGFIIAGNILHNKSNIQCLFSRTESLHDNLQKFWKIEEIGSSDLMSSDHEIREEHFTNTVSRDDSGRFVVRIPLKGSPSELGNSKPIATKRLLNMESRFKRDSNLKQQYVSFMKEYLELGHMSPDTTYNNDSATSYFLPHHGVMRECSMTTKLRVVFDGSAITTSGKSLNSIQHTGPPIQSDIFETLLRFRVHEFAVVADIEKMYRCILVHSDDRPLQKILWRNDSSDPITIMTLNTVTYGTASAPYLAMRCLKQVALDAKDSFPNSSKVILRDFYVDDLITAFDDIEVGRKTCQEISEILSSAGFNLRKWASNNSQILQNFHDSLDSLRVLKLGGCDPIKTLGIQWFPELDMLGYSISIPNDTVVTKRSILSEIAKIYDPLGLLSACTIVVKILIQKLWTLQYDWDSSLPPELCREWITFKSQLCSLNELKIPRFVSSNNLFKVELHGFSDASQSAYSAAVYLRCLNKNNTVSVNLICAKTKVAPLKILTIPRLELCGALLLARLMKIVSNSFDTSLDLFYWCDSQITLHWLNSEPSSLQVFVGNRVSEIQNISNKTDWYYVQSKENPADVASRGIMPNMLGQNQLWWCGPRFLYDTLIPKKFETSSLISVPELKMDKSIIVALVKTKLDIFDRFSKFKRLVHVHAYCLRFIFNLRSSKKGRKTGPLSTSELEESTLNLVKLAQAESFSEEITIIQSNKELKAKHKLQALTPFVDTHGLLRVGGRLNHSLLNYDRKHPLLLDGKHKLSRLLVEYEHNQLLHAGPQLLLSSVRQNYPTSGVSLAKSVVRNCLRCFKFKPKPHSTFMADLPEPRVSVSYPFTHTGVDYAGPFILKDRKGRGCKSFKAYICLFICFSTKAVHLELVTDLTAEAFIASFRRFTCRRGKPLHLYSDNGSNFGAAQKELKLFFEFLQNSYDHIYKVLADDNTEWHFIPPNSPTFGGLWESNIKGVKHHLSRVLLNTLLTYEEFLTVLVQVEAILNSRPLYPMSSDPNDFEPLTPSHFLIGKTYTSVPDPQFKENVRINQLSRFQFLQQLSQGFWKHWSQSYLSQLQTRSKWRNKTTNLEIGKLVLIRNEILPPCKWLLGRVIEVHPGQDKIVRVVTVKTYKGQFKRSINKLCPLPDLREVRNDL